MARVTSALYDTGSGRRVGGNAAFRGQMGGRWWLGLVAVAMKFGRDVGRMAISETVGRLGYGVGRPT